MSLLRQHKQDLIAMATHDVDETTRARLMALIESDDQCAAYWQELIELTERMESSQQAAKSNHLPEGFHFELRQEIQRSERIGKVQVKNRPIQLLLKPAIVLSAVAAAIFLVSQFIETSQSGGNNDLPVVLSPLETPQAVHSWAVLRHTQRAPTTPTTSYSFTKASQTTLSMAWAERNALIEALDL